MMKIKTDKFKEDLKKILPSIEVLGEYKTMKTKIKVKCSEKDCNNEWSTTPDNLLRRMKHGCPVCAKKELNNTWKNNIN